MAVFFVVLIASLYLLGTIALQLERFGNYYHWLLIGNGLALSFIAWLLLVNGARLLREFRARVAGSRLTLKLVAISVLLALVPVTLVYGFSIRFLRANINSYFDLEIEQTLDDALELSRESLSLQMRTLQRDTINIAQQLTGINEDDAVLVLNELTAEGEASEMTLVGPNNRIVASTGLPGSLSVQPDRPDDDLVARARRGLPYVGVDPVGEGELYVRVVTPVFSENAARENSVLQALYPVARRSADLAESVQNSYQQYRQLVFLRQPLILSSMLTLSLALLLSVMMAVWFAFYTARRMMMPVHDLVEGTRAVAEGDYSTRIYKRSKNDELGFLVQSFNYMTLQLDQARSAAEHSRRENEQQRAWLQSVLTRISSGVITLDADHRVMTCNVAAVDILTPSSREPQQEPGATPDFAALEGKSLVRPISDVSVLAQFGDGLVPLLEQAHDDDFSTEIEISDETGRRLLFCRGSLPLDVTDGPAGRVIVIDDMTAVISAQRDAAWSEVARRLAHEIKNPLTPIQLSAERLRHKFSTRVDAQDRELLTRLTRTIENQVDAMKSMVDAFADYAAAPTLVLVQTDINGLVSEVAELYGSADDGGAVVTTELAPELPSLPVDVARLRQLVHNLVKNALEAQSGQEPSVHLRTCRIEDDRGSAVFAEVVCEDRGSGFAPELLNRLFEPYVTSKPKGTGLGLAIVKKIVEEHGGTIRLDNRSGADSSMPASGARVTVRLPYLSTPPVRAGVMSDAHQGSSAAISGVASTSAGRSASTSAPVGLPDGISNRNRA